MAYWWAEDFKPWFAWRPVKTEDGKFVWFRWIERAVLKMNGFVIRAAYREIRT